MFFPKFEWQKISRGIQLFNNFLDVIYVCYKKFRFKSSSSTENTVLTFEFVTPSTI